MSLDHAILGFLNYRPFSGYDLKKMFDSSVRHFWYADQSQIYRTLTRLQEQGWVVMDVVEQVMRPDRKVYSITSTGQDELRAWLLAPIQAGQPHSSPLVQIFFAGQLSDAEALAMFERAAMLMRGFLSVYDHVPEQVADYQQMVGSAREAWFWMLTLELGKLICRHSWRGLKVLLHGLIIMKYRL